MNTLIVLCVSVMAAVATPAELYRPIQVQDTNAVSNFNLDALTLNIDDLGLLRAAPLPVNEDFTAIMLDLLPEFTGVLKKFSGAGSSQFSPSGAVSSFFPIVRMAIEKKAKNEGRSLTKDEERLLTLSETSINLSTNVIDSLSLKADTFKIITDVMGIVKPIMEVNALSQDRKLTEAELAEIKQIEGIAKFTLQTMKDLKSENTVAGIVNSNLRLARAVMESNAKAQGKWSIAWEDEQTLNQIRDTINMALEISTNFQSMSPNMADMVPSFMKLSNFIYNTRAAHENRGITWEEQKQLRFTEATLKNALGFTQDLATGNASEDTLKNFMVNTRKLIEQRRTNSF
ncbi:unnamed protein product [Meganyctiphanes norvegica]|uniref:Uncharacterized protein n=1 Tax=Meganyctiphanes norvegica TaxID=48144 RepID=A0AAV2Q502_MEGNR